MYLNRDKISHKQLYFLIIAFTISSSIILPPGKAAGNDAPFAIIFAFFEILIPLTAYLKLTERYPGATLIQINELILGGFVSKLVSLIMILYFIENAGSAAYVITNFLSTQIFFSTPHIVLALPLTCLSVWAALNGIEVVGRCSEILVPAFMCTSFMVTLLVSPQMNLSFIKPLFQTPIKTFFWVVHSIATYAFGQLIAFSMVLPAVNKPQQARKTSVLAVATAASFFALVIIRNIVVLGPTLSTSQHPSFTVASLINIGDVITRLDVAISANFMTFGFLKLAVLSYVILLSIGQLFRLRTIRPLGIPLAILIVLFSLILTESSTQQAEFIEKVYPLYAIPFQYILPVGLLILSYLLPGARKKAHNTQS